MVTTAKELDTHTVEVLIFHLLDTFNNFFFPKRLLHSLIITEYIKKSRITLRPSTLQQNIAKILKIV